jgi:hypothetical protein
MDLGLFGQDPAAVPVLYLRWCPGEAHPTAWWITDPLTAGVALPRDTAVLLVGGDAQHDLVLHEFPGGQGHVIAMAPTPYWVRNT